MKQSRKVLIWRVDKNGLPPKSYPRNAACYCGSGIKFKKCHGVQEAVDMQNKILDANGHLPKSAPPPKPNYNSKPTKLQKAGKRIAKMTAPVGDFIPEVWTKTEAVREMGKGKKVTHRNFTPEEWVSKRKDGKYVLEDGVVCTSTEFWKYRKGIEWETGWKEWSLHII